MILSKEWRWN